MSVIPVSVLINVCKAIEGDKDAMEQAQQQMVGLEPEFILKLGASILLIDDQDVRRWAWNEIRGVSDDSDSGAA